MSRGCRCSIARSRPSAQVQSNNRQNKNDHRSDDQHDQIPSIQGAMRDTVRPDQPPQREGVHKKNCAGRFSLQIIWPLGSCYNRRPKRIGGGDPRKIAHEVHISVGCVPVLYVCVMGICSAGGREFRKWRRSCCQAFWLARWRIHILRTQFNHTNHRSPEEPTQRGQKRGM